MWTGKRSQHGILDGSLGESLDGSHGESLDRDQRLSPEETLHTQLALSQFHRYMVTKFCTYSVHHIISFRHRHLSILSL